MQIESDKWGDDESGKGNGRYVHRLYAVYGMNVSVINWLLEQFENRFCEQFFFFNNFDANFFHVRLMYVVAGVLMGLRMCTPLYVHKHIRET